MTRRAWVASMIGVAAAVLAATLPARTTAAAASPERAKPLIVMIGHPDCAGIVGAGIVVGAKSDRLYIATADHVVRCKGRRLDTVEVRFRSLPGERITAKVLEDLDRGLDLTVLSVVGVRQHGIQVDDIPFGLLGDAEALSHGDEVFMMGNPQGRIWDINVRPALVKEVTPDRVRFETVLVAKGHSGGGLFTGQWELVGMIIEDEPPNPRAVPIDRVIRRLRQWGYPVQLALSAGAPPKPAVADTVGASDKRSAGTSEADRATAAQSLAGKWRGQYRYSDERVPPKPFEVTIEVDHATKRFSGRVSEPRLTIFGMSGRLSANIEGAIADDGSVRFVKTYGEGSGMTRPVTYEGRLEDDGARFSGTWKAEEWLTGTFEMTRSDGG